MTAPTLPEFILARVADLEAAVRTDDFEEAAHTTGCGYDAIETGSPCECPWPARVLAQCAAYRSIVALHSGEPSCESCYDFAPMTAPCPTLRALATIWADHPDFDERWRP